MSEHDYATRINHLAADHLGRIFGTEAKAQVQAIIDEAVAAGRAIPAGSVEAAAREISQVSNGFFTPAFLQGILRKHFSQPPASAAPAESRDGGECQKLMSYGTWREAYAAASQGAETWKMEAEAGRLRIAELEKQPQAQGAKG